MDARDQLLTFVVLCSLELDCSLVVEEENSAEWEAERRERERVGDR